MNNFARTLRLAALCIAAVCGNAGEPVKFRVKVAFDGKDPVETAVPRSDSNIGEKDPVRNAAVQDNFIRVRIPVPADAKTAKIFAVDPGVVIDAVVVADSAN